eukprot:5611757-Pyramimonas_sp.AAC.2
MGRNKGQRGCAFAAYRACSSCSKVHFAGEFKRCRDWRVQRHRRVSTTLFKRTSIKLPFQNVASTKRLNMSSLTETVGSAEVRIVLHPTPTLWTRQNTPASSTPRIGIALNLILAPMLDNAHQMR